MKTGVVVNNTRYDEILGQLRHKANNCSNNNDQTDEVNNVMYFVLPSSSLVRLTFQRDFGSASS